MSFVRNLFLFAFLLVVQTPGRANVEMQPLVEQPIKLVTDVPPMMQPENACAERMLYVLAEV